MKEFQSQSRTSSITQRQIENINIDQSHLQSYKKILLLKVLLVFFLLLLLILERVFVDFIQIKEQTLISKMQISYGIIQGSEKLSDNILFKLFRLINQNKFFIILVSHFYFLIFAFYDVVISLKVQLLQLFSILPILTLQLLYKTERPYWENQKILSMCCSKSFSQPDEVLFYILFTSFYFEYCVRIKNQNQSPNTSNSKIQSIVLILISVIISIVYIILSVISGQIYMLEIALTLVYFTLFYYLAITMNTQIDQILIKTIINPNTSKKYVFYILIIVLSIVAINFGLYYNSQLFLEINWIINFVNCPFDNITSDLELRTTELIGPFYSFRKSFVCFGFAGTLFGASRTFRSLQNAYWYKSQIRSLKQNVLLAISMNLILTLAWIISIYSIQIGQLFTKSGLNEYVIYSISLFLVNYLAYGIIPSFLLRKIEYKYYFENQMPLLDNIDKEFSQ